MDDLTEGQRLATQLGASTGGEITRVQVIVIELPPGPKARPRFGPRGQVYKPDATEENATAWLIRKAMTSRYEGPVAVGAIFYRKTRHRADIDNLLKRVFDAATAARLWKDDSQVVTHLALMRHDPVRPRTVLVVGRYHRAVVPVG